MKNQITEIIVGFLVVLIAVIFIGYAALTIGQAKTGKGYELLARFNKVNGIASGTDVRIAGVKIGSVSEVHLNPKSFLAEVKLRLPDSIRLPIDSSAKVVSDGLLGQSYLSIEPGGEEENLGAGEEISYTQGSVDLFELIGKTVFQNAGDQPKK